MKFIVATSIVAIVLYFEDQNNYGGYYTDRLGHMVLAIWRKFRLPLGGSPLFIDNDRWSKLGSRLATAS
jgi:hypothetical protein